MYSSYQVKNILCGSVFRSVFQFSSDYSPMRGEMTKKKNLKSQPSGKCSLVQFNRAQFECVSQNTPRETTKNKNSNICHTPLISFQASMKQYYGMP